MLIPDVAMLSQYQCRIGHVGPLESGSGGRLTVEICCGVDAKSLYRPCQVPHFLQGRALTEGDRDADEREDDLERNRRVAQHTETFSDGC